MKTIQSLIAITTFAVGMTTAASAAQSDPETILYRVPGVVDNGGAMFAGVATVVSCTNFSGATENVRFVTRDLGGTLVSNSAFPVGHLKTFNVATHPVLSYAVADLATAQVFGGTIAIAATSINIICTALITDAGTSLPHGVSLRAIRFNPVAGSQE